MPSKGSPDGKSGTGGALGMRIRAKRVERGLTLAALGAATGFTKGYLSLVERGVKVPTIASLVKVSFALQIPLAYLFAENPPDEPVAVVRKRDRKPLAPPAAMRSRRDYVYESLTYPASTRHLEGFTMRPPIGDAGNPLHDHEGEEFFFVLSGRIELRLPDRSYRFSPGDCGFFLSKQPHAYRSVSRDRAEVLLVIHPASYEGRSRPPRGAGHRTPRRARGKAGSRDRSG